MTLEQALEQAIRRLYESGRTGQSLRRSIKFEVQRIIDLYGARAELNKTKFDAPADSVLKKLIKIILKELDAESFAKFREQYEANPDQHTAIVNAQKQIIDTMSRNFDRIDRIAVREISRTIGQYDDWREAVRKSLIKAGRLKHHAETELETTLSAMDTASTVLDAIDVDGANAVFRYEGPSGTRRPFCASKVGKTFTIADIKTMKNGQGLPALYYRGGYNCRHRWVAVIKDETNLLRKNLFDLQNKKTLNYRQRDLVQDLHKHAAKLNLSKEEYINEAIQVVKNSKISAVKKRHNKWQYEFYGERGYAVTDPDGTIRGYFFSENIEKTLNERAKKVQSWKRLK